MNQTAACGEAKVTIENFRPDWLEVTVSRAVLPLREAIESALALLYPVGLCSENACEGCKAEAHKAAEILREALGA